MRVLMTNDDGIDAPGLHRLAAAVAAAGHQVVVAAPAAEASGSSAALTAVTDQDRVRIQRRTPPSATADYNCLAVAASPAYIALLGVLGAFGQRPDVVLSGINRGANAGHAVLHSGTVGAALTAANNGVPAMAVSLDILTAAAGAVLDATDDEARNWDTAALLAADLLAARADLSAATVLNVNVPDLPVSRLRGLRRSRLADFGQVQVAIAETGEDFVRTSLREQQAELDADTDLAHLADGYASITAIRGVRDAADATFRLPRAWSITGRASPTAG